MVPTALRSGPPTAEGLDAYSTCTTAHGGGRVGRVRQPAQPHTAKGLAPHRQGLWAQGNGQHLRALWHGAAGHGPATHRPIDLAGGHACMHCAAAATPPAGAGCYTGRTAHYGFGVCAYLPLAEQQRALERRLDAVLGQLSHLRGGGGGASSGSISAAGTTRALQRWLGPCVRHTHSHKLGLGGVPRAHTGRSMGSALMWLRTKIRAGGHAVWRLHAGGACAPPAPTVPCCSEPVWLCRPLPALWSCGRCAWPYHPAGAGWVDR